VPEITIHATTNPAGQVVETRLCCDDGRLAIAVSGEVMPLPDGALEAVMKRYGKALAADPKDMMVDEELDLGEGRRLVRFRFMSRYDVIARDYLVLYDPEGEPLCELATAITAALDHLARRLAAG